MTSLLANYLNQTSLIMELVPSLQKIEEAIIGRKLRGKCIKIMYGETFDFHGLTVDSLKYYFAVAGISRAIRESGAKAVPTILVADIASCRNEPEKHHETLMAIGRKRVRQLTSLRDLYSLDINILLMSDYLHGNEFQNSLERIRAKAVDHREIYHWIRQTVPESKLKIEEDKEFTYAFEEIATIIEYDMKVGPPREQFYDEPARLIGNSLGLDPLISVYLHPTFPLGLGPDFFLANREIEQFGVTAYKAGSKGLLDHRLVLGHTSPERLYDLINETFVGKKPTTPNPVLDLAIIAELARQWLQHEIVPLDLREKFYSGQLSPAQLKQLASENIDRYILSPLVPLLKESLD